MLIATTGDPVIQMHRGIAESARSAAAGLPVVSAVGMRADHAAILESALGETRRELGELVRLADVGAAGAEGISQQDAENASRYEGWDGPERRRNGTVPPEGRVV
ncbi:hypothetical protein [Mycobacteroides chelonae]|uniref:hypothetical protein n=1 Tax=Mycobacteroides chelonae TaxID=1774 RepID=UPI001F1E4721|nr:hypothetical protein [Mycobacteroides chelonae]UJW67163.1 hypothetical protein H0I67_07585 [Mycobacteroides chelonae]